MKRIRRHAIAIVLAVTGLIVAAVLYPKLPAQVPVHWSGTGAADRWMPKDVGAFMQPVISLAVVGLLMVVEPTDWHERQAGPVHWIYPMAVEAFSGFMLCVTVLMLLAGMGTHVSIPTGVTVGIGILFAALGTNFGKVPANSPVGIRLPWTVSNREIWLRTHTVAGWLLTLAGLATAAFALASREPSSAIFGAVAIIASVLVAGAYSFVLSRGLLRDGTSRG